MRLQRLEILGFKSFPDRSELAFDQGVTAIVGPNGCGKSNVVDAITWVLGEQSAKSLRGDRMEDVIFGGSDARKPTSAAEVRLRLCGVASRVPGNGKMRHSEPVVTSREVVLAGDVASVGEAVAVLDEPPLIVRDVELSRRLYRSGESEYLIDGEVCRLKDVQDLLMDAGLGIKAYAVIEQGKIGQILSARPTDRRQLIEEAAGVTKYKSRRRTAELKLEAAQQNLTRVDDIIFEVEKQRGALKRQAAKARRYRRLRDELRRWEKVQFARRYRRARRGDRGRARTAGGRACARDRCCRAPGGCRSAPRGAAAPADGGRRSDDRGAGGGARARAVDRASAATGRVRQAAGRRARRLPRRLSRPSLRRSTRGASRRARSSTIGVAARRACDGRSRPGGRRADGAGRELHRRASRRSKASRGTSRRRAAKCSPQ